MQRRTIASLGLMATPIIVFYILLTRAVINLPFLDDYSGVLGFLDRWTEISSLSGKIMYILTSQHNEYKIMFANATFAIQYKLYGHVNFVVLSVFGNLFILGVFAILYKMWRYDKRLAGQPLVLFVPVAWVLFQLQYYSLLDWPMSSLQEAVIMFFALLSIYLLSKGDSRSFCGSLVALVFSIASSGNGVFLIPIGILMLFEQRQIARIMYWLTTSVLMIALYLYKYNYNQSQSHANHSIMSSLHHFSILYMLGFLGASVGGYRVNAPVILLGLCFCVLFVVSIIDKYYLINPAIFYSICFIMLTAFGVSGLRSDFGIDQSLASRYRVYSNLMVILFYCYVVGRWQGTLRSVGIRRVAAGLLLLAAIAFNVASTSAGFRLLRVRKAGTIEGMRRWEHGETPITDVNEGPDEDPVIRRQRLNGNFAPEGAFLKEAIARKIFVPQQY